MAIPFIVSNQVDAWHKPVDGSELLQESNWHVKLGLSLLTLVLAFSMVKLSNGVVVRKSIKKSNV